MQNNRKEHLVGLRLRFRENCRGYSAGNLWLSMFESETIQKEKLGEANHWKIMLEGSSR
jgi:hypothetical protein